MHAKKRKGAFHEPHGAAGILPAEESASSADETSAAPCWRHHLTPSMFMVPMHSIKVVRVFHEIATLQIRREEPRHTVAQSHRQRASVHFFERDSFCPAQFVLDDRRHLAREFASVTFD